jgi:L-cystine uptake protein TcyP (sodium:dicarboxylate symporter family)
MRKQTKAFIITIVIFILVIIGLICALAGVLHYYLGGLAGLGSIFAGKKGIDQINKIRESKQNDQKIINNVDNDFNNSPFNKSRNKR